MGWTVSSDLYFSSRSMDAFWALGGLLGAFWMPVAPDFGSLMPVIGTKMRQTKRVDPFVGGLIYTYLN